MASEPKSSTSKSQTMGRAILVGAGPGDPDLITLRGASALGRADVVLFDELATDELLHLAPERAEKINVGKRGGIVVDKQLRTLAGGICAIGGQCSDLIARCFAVFHGVA